MQNYRRFRSLQESVKKTSSIENFDISEAFNELSTLSEDAIQKETDQLCSVEFGEGNQVFTGTREECEDYIKKNPDPSGKGRLTIKDTAKVNVQEAIKEKETDQLCSVVMGTAQLFVGTEQECKDWIAKANGPNAAKLRLKKSANVAVQESASITEDGEPSELKPGQSDLCDKCGKARAAVQNSYSQTLCFDCFDKYADSDEGRLELFVEIAQGIKDASNFSAAEIKAAADSWSKHRYDTAFWLKPTRYNRPK